ncbi:Spx/MgsR family RNA polymerase-binding regulatory protein [Pseudidiomarina insulisalsae]|uniref:Arsenate reductase n=1 Tax=Pseudidiomarina insulisalsae TaxID=575789 RepID=A0A432YMU0_9GAMM|nr:Spx/MgsR family RNA polymerase-binding regulatory protein [Pseudidiomarina insulisalsae]RUO62175.1 arsenate reductase [Pseudidiomarina insulisalsae]
MTVKLYGIPNCDTVRKARRFLEQHDVNYDFQNVREQLLHAETLTLWLQKVDRDTLINKRSASWRQLTNDERELHDNAAAIELLQRYPTLMKRPVLEVDEHLLVGFDEAQWQQVLER